VVNTPRQDRRFSHQVDTEFDFSTNSLVAVPLATPANVIGVIELLNKRDGQEFAETDVTLLLILAQIAASVLQQLDERLTAAEAAASV
jgi:GAF domain-containing protein